MLKFFRFLYLNTYAFVLLFCGIIIITIPLFRISKLLIIPQIITSLLFIKESSTLFSTWKDKQLKYKILILRNRKIFRPNTFEIFMQAPCGRLLTKAVLKDLGLKKRYKELLVFKTPLIASIKKGCVKTETKIYMNTDYK